MCGNDTRNFHFGGWITQYSVRIRKEVWCSIFLDSGCNTSLPAHFILICTNLKLCVLICKCIRAEGWRQQGQGATCWRYLVLLFFPISTPCDAVSMYSEHLSQFLRKFMADFSLMLQPLPLSKPTPTPMYFSISLFF